MNTQSILDKIQNDKEFFEQLLHDPFTALQGQGAQLSEDALQVLRSLEQGGPDDLMADVNFFC